VIHLGLLITWRSISRSGRAHPQEKTLWQQWCSGFYTGH